VRSGQEVAGFYGLKEVLPVELVDWLDGIAERVRVASTPRIVAHGQVGTQPQAEEPHSTRKEFADIPQSALTGWVGDYAAVMKPTTEAPEAFHVGSRHGCRRAARSHPCPVRPIRPYANLYTLVGRPGRTRKDTAIKR
jgi:hypothetical protein